MGSGFVLAVISNSLVFSLLHGFNIAPSKELVFRLINILLFGLYISVYAIREQSLWGVCGWHAAWNWLLGVGFGLEVSGQRLDVTPLVVDLASTDAVPWFITGGQFGPEASLVTMLVLLIAIAITRLRGNTEGYAVEAAQPEQ